MKRAPVVGPYSDVSQEEDAPATAVNLPQKKKGKKEFRNTKIRCGACLPFFGFFVLQVKRRRREKKRGFGFLKIPKK